MSSYPWVVYAPKTIATALKCLHENTPISTLKTHLTLINGAPHIQPLTDQSIAFDTPERAQRFLDECLSIALEHAKIQARTHLKGGLYRLDYASFSQSCLYLYHTHTNSQEQLEFSSKALPPEPIEQLIRDRKAFFESDLSFLSFQQLQSVASACSQWSGIWQHAGQHLSSNTKVHDAASVASSLRFQLRAFFSLFKSARKDPFFLQLQSPCYFGAPIPHHVYLPAWAQLAPLCPLIAPHTHTQSFTQTHQQWVVRFEDGFLSAFSKTTGHHYCTPDLHKAKTFPLQAQALAAGQSDKTGKPFTLLCYTLTPTLIEPHGTATGALTQFGADFEAHILQEQLKERLLQAHQHLPTDSAHSIDPASVTPAVPPRPRARL